LTYALRAPVSKDRRLDFHPHTYKTFGPYLGEKNLNLGCGRNLEAGFINLDRVAGPGVDRVTNLDYEVQPDWPDNWIGGYQEFDCILASHVLEHIRNLIPLMRECHRILRPGGHLLIVAPHASSDDAWEDPTHVRAFTEQSWIYFDRRIYETPGHHGYYPSDVDFIFEAVEVRLVPQDDVAAELKANGIPAEVALNFGKRFLRNTIREVVAILRKVEG